MTTDNITISRAALEKIVGALERANELVTGERWGTQGYMDIQVYDDAAKLAKVTNSALTEARAAMAQAESAAFDAAFDLRLLGDQEKAKIKVTVAQIKAARKAFYSRNPPVNGSTWSDPFSYQDLAAIYEAMVLAGPSHPQATEPQALEQTCQMCGEKPYPGCNSEFQDDKACLFYPKSTEPAPNPWKDAVLDQLAAHCMDAPVDMPPADILKRVIYMAVTMATDPAISEPAPSTAGERERIELERWGRSEKLCLRLLDRMDDGYWTPWHIATEAIAALQKEIDSLSSELTKAQDELNCTEQTLEAASCELSGPEFENGFDCMGDFAMAVWQGFKKKLDAALLSAPALPVGELTDEQRSDLYWLLTCAAENLRSADKDERRIEAAFRMASQMDSFCAIIASARSQPVREPLTEAQIAESTLAADRAQWLADNFDSSHDHFNEALDKLRAYAKLIRDLLVAHGITKKGQP